MLMRERGQNHHPKVTIWVGTLLLQAQYSGTLARRRRHTSTLPTRLRNVDRRGLIKLLIISTTRFCTIFATVAARASLTNCTEFNTFIDRRNDVSCTARSEKYVISVYDLVV